MTAVSRVALQGAADIVKNETAAAANTADRVGSVMRDTADSVVFIGDAAVDSGSATERGWIAYQASTDALGARFVAKKSRGSISSPADIAAGDCFGEFVGLARLGGSFAESGKLRFIQSTIASGGNTSFQLQLHDGNALSTITQTQVRKIFTTDATPTTVITIPMANADGVMALTALWHGLDPAGHKITLIKQTFVYRRVNTAGPTQLGTSVDVIPLFKDDAACGTPAVVVSGNNLLFQVTGKAATIYTWDVEVTHRELN